jgi:hypothetical protein
VIAITAASNQMQVFGMKRRQTVTGCRQWVQQYGRPALDLSEGRPPDSLSCIIDESRDGNWSRVERFV